MEKEEWTAFTEAEIQNGLVTDVLGKRIVAMGKVCSTNDEAKKMAVEGAVDGTVVVSEEQTGGRGRLDRKFFSPPGKGLWFSIILRPLIMPEDAPKFTLLSAVALVDAMGEFGVDAGIKWPNDILDRKEHRKLAGVLTEMRAEVGRIEYIVLGIGVNVNTEIDDFTEEIRLSAGSMRMVSGSLISRSDFLRTLLRRLDELYIMVFDSGFVAILDMWRKRSLTLGKAVKVIEADEGKIYFGEAMDIDESGELIVKSEGKIRKVMAGDVSIRFA